MLAFLSCQDVIDIETPDRAVSLVVEGKVTNTMGTTAKVSLTASYFNQGATPVVNDANVQLLENGAVVSVLSRDTIDGGYRSAFNGVVGNDYEIRVEVPNNSSSGFRASTWQSKPERLSRVFDLDSFNIRTLNRTTTPNVFEEGDYALVYFQEPEGRGDYYRWRIWENDSLFTQTLFTFDDEFIDGGYFGGAFLPGFVYFGAINEPGDSLGIEVTSISKEYSTFLNLIGEQSFQVGGPFAAPPAAVIGNIYNVDDPDEFGFGYFIASAVSSGGITYRP